MGRRLLLALSVALAVLSAVGLCACSGEEAATGADFNVPSSIIETSYDMSDALTSNGASINTTFAADGYVLACANNSNRLKLQVSAGQMSYNYDLANDGTVEAFPLQMGDGAYEIRVMQNTSENNYVEICRTTCNVTLTSEFAPFERPNMYCNYSENSDCVATAREIAASCTNEGEVVAAVYNYIVQNISYDSAKAASVSDVSGYVPNPDETLATGTGICFDYASLAAAMLRSLGIPCKIVTGYVSPNNLYHAWNLVYVDGSWKSASVSINANAWSIIDTTFAAADPTNNYVGDGSSYTERYTY